MVRVVNPQGRVTMTLNQNDIEELKSSVGGSNSGANAPNNHNVVGALNAMEQVAEKMDAYGVADPANLPDGDRDKYNEAHEDLQYHLKNLPNLLLDSMVAQDDSIELPNGNSVDLPKQATEKSSNSKKVPNSPS